MRAMGVATLDNGSGFVPIEELPAPLDSSASPRWRRRWLVKGAALAISGMVVVAVVALTRTPQRAPHPVVPPAVRVVRPREPKRPAPKSRTRTPRPRASTARPRGRKARVRHHPTHEPPP